MVLKSGLLIACLAVNKGYLKRGQNRGELAFTHTGKKRVKRDNTFEYLMEY